MSSFWRYMAAPTTHHMSSNTTRRAELACFLIGLTISAAAAFLLMFAAVALVSAA